MTTSRNTLLLALAAGLLAGIPASAQFYQNGADPFGRWSTMSTEHYRIVYPEGKDSLARAYILDLEKWQPSVGVSAGMDPVGLQWGRLPVILHPYYPHSNGSVAWAPKRMDLYTHPEPYGSQPLSWMTQLTVHESRHVAQMQLAYRRPFRWVNYLVGEMWPGAVSALFTPQPFLEGDAVVTETALTHSGRGRDGDFLNYYHVAFDGGDWRDWYQWIYGSFKKAAPDYYATGYMTIAGMRYFYDQPAFTAGYFDWVTRHPFPVTPLQRYIRTLSGQSFKKTFRTLQEGFRDQWAEEADARGPFMPMEQVTRTPSFATDYTGGTWVDGKYYVIKESKTTATRMIRLDPDGTEHDMGSFSGSTSSFYVGEDRIFWSETLPGVRWDLDGESILRWMDLDGKHRHDLTVKGRMYNPQPGPDGVLAVVEYPVNGGCNILIVNEKDGSILRRTPAPEGIQLTESAWIGNDIHCLGLDDRGYGIWRLREGCWTCVLEPSPQMMENLDGGDMLELVSDRNGVKELYRYDPETDKAWQLSNTRYGANDFSMSDDGELWFRSMTPEGNAIFKARAPEPVEVDIRQVHRDRVAEKLSEQENALLQAAGNREKGTMVVSEPQRYLKPLHWMKFHSWAPIWFNYDLIESMSGDFSYDTASPGLVGLFQNDLGTTWGAVGYSAHPDEDRAGEWRHGGHLHFTHTGLYPVLEATFDIYDKGAYLYQFQDREYPDHMGYAILRRDLDRLTWTGKVSAYVPFRFHKDGIQRGVIPQVSWSVSNNPFDTGVTHLEMHDDFIRDEAHAAYLGYDPGERILMQNLRGSVRGYWMQQAADSQVYPRLGIGAEAGAGFRPGLSQIYSPACYGYVYGYLPGLTRTQGLRLSAIGAQQFATGAPFGEYGVSVIPRGFTPVDGSAIARHSARALRLTADYAVPLYVGDISWFSPVAYITHFLLIPHVDWTTFGGARNGQGPVTASSLFSAGADFTVELANFLWVPFPCSIGVSASWTGGPYYNTLATDGRKPWSVEMVFSFDI